MLSLQYKYYMQQKAKLVSSLKKFFHMTEVLCFLKNMPMCSMISVYCHLLQWILSYFLTILKVRKCIVLNYSSIIFSTIDLVRQFSIQYICSLLPIICTNRVFNNLMISSCLVWLCSYLFLLVMYLWLPLHIIHLQSPHLSLTTPIILHI